MIDVNVDQVARQWLEGLKPEIKTQLGDSYRVLLNQLNADEDDEREETDDCGNYEFPC